LNLLWGSGLLHRLGRDPWPGDRQRRRNSVVRDRLPRNRCAEGQGCVVGNPRTEHKYADRLFGQLRDPRHHSLTSTLPTASREPRGRSRPVPKSSLARPAGRRRRFRRESPGPRTPGIPCGRSPLDGESRAVPLTRQMPLCIPAFFRGHPASWRNQFFHADGALRPARLTDRPKPVARGEHSRRHGWLHLGPTQRAVRSRLARGRPTE